MDNPFLDRELLQQERKDRKKERKQGISDARLLKEKRCSIIKTQGLTKGEKRMLRGQGLNQHVNSKAPMQVSLQALQVKKVDVKKKVDSKKFEVTPYSGNPLDSSHPKRFKGKHREEPKTKKLSRLKLDILDCEQARLGKNDNELGLVNYCTNEVTPALDNAVKAYIMKLMPLQQNAYLKDPLNLKNKKRLICGLHEIKVKLDVGKLVFFVIATDMIICHDESLYKRIQEILSVADDKRCPYAFALKRSQLGYYSKIRRRVSCIGVLNHEGAEEEFKKVQEEIIKIPIQDNKEEEAKAVNEGIMKKFKELLIRDPVV